MALPMTAYLAIDAGGTFLKSAVLDSNGDVFQDSSISYSSYSEGTKDQILQAFNKIINEGLGFINNGGLNLKGIGIAFPGPFDIAKSTPLMKHKYQSIYGLHLRKVLYENSGVSQDIPISFIHDANAVLSGELWKGNAQGFLNAAVVTLGTGLGFAISENGKVLCNEMGGPLISLFKLPYDKGILEDYTAKQGIIRIYSELSGDKDVRGIEVSDIGKMADNENSASIRTFEQVGITLASSLLEILDEKNIECLLFSGQISRSFHHIEKSLNDGLKRVKCLKKISVVKSIDNAALLGAVRNMM